MLTSIMQTYTVCANTVQRIFHEVMTFFVDRGIALLTFYSSKTDRVQQMPAQHLAKRKDFGGLQP
jgi:hypothetical protein